MYCDYNSLAEYAIVLSKKINEIKYVLNGIEESIDTIVALSNWDTQTRDYFYDMCNHIINNIDILNNKFMNINQYIDSVIINYKSFDNMII